MIKGHNLQALKTKQKVTDQKLQQAEDSYSQAKQLYDEITDELYEELPSFFDRYEDGVVGRGYQFHKVLI